MNQNSPYHIKNVQLNDFNSIQSLFEKTERLYIVCWYQSLALAHFYKEEDQHIEDVLQYVWQHILPALENYITDDGELEHLKIAFLNTGAGFDKLMAQALKDYLPNNIPDKAPISLIICTANRAAALRNCLQSVFEQTCQPLEVIVVDNAPSEETKAICNEWPVFYVPEQSRGLSYARNTGIKNASQPIIAWTDDDVTVHTLWCYRIWEGFQKTNASVILGLVIASELETESQQVFEKFWSFNRGYVHKQYDFEWFRDRFKYGPPVWELGAGANMAFRKNVFYETGDFDVRLGAGASGCSEDSEMWFRILKNHGTILYDPKPIVYHTHRKGLEVLKKQLHSYMKGFVVAALIQQRQLPAANYKRQLFRILPLHYLRLIKAGFPKYESRFVSLFPEIRGIINGFRFYNKTK